MHGVGRASDESATDFVGAVAPDVAVHPLLGTRPGHLCRHITATARPQHGHSTATATARSQHGHGHSTVTKARTNTATAQQHSGTAHGHSTRSAQDRHGHSTHLPHRLTQHRLHRRNPGVAAPGLSHSTTGLGHLDI